MCATALEQCHLGYPIDKPLLESSGTPARRFRCEGTRVYGAAERRRRFRSVWVGDRRTVEWRGLGSSLQPALAVWVPRPFQGWGLIPGLFNH